MHIEMLAGYSIKKLKVTKFIVIFDILKIVFMSEILNYMENIPLSLKYEEERVFSYVKMKRKHSMKTFSSHT